MPITEIEILWITAGLGCDGETIALTGATQPSLEDLVLGGMPVDAEDHLPQSAARARKRRRVPGGLPSARPRATLGPFILVVEGSIPDEQNKAEGYWAALGTDPPTGQPITTCEWIDRLAPHAWAVMAVGTCATYGGIHAMAGNPTGCMGLPDYLGWDWQSTAGIPIVCVPGLPDAARQPDAKRCCTCCTWPRVARR